LTHRYDGARGIHDVSFALPRGTFTVVTGKIGSGKTTLLQTLLRNIDSQTTVGRIVNTMLEPRELIETILIDFGLEAQARSKPQMLRDLAQYLVDQRLAGRLVLLVIDEAQNLGLAALEELRMLSNLETEKSKLMQIVMVGQPDLRDKLQAPALEQLRQRITVSYHLQPLDAGETANYINHRLRRAALGAALEFPREVTDVIHARSRGVPRIFNVICDAALVFGYAEERRQVDHALIEDVLGELELTGVLIPESAPVEGPAAAVPERRPEPAFAGALAPASTLAPPSTLAHQEDLRRAEMAGRAAMEQAARRAAEIEQREETLRQRERELAEQRRILAEEYRLLRVHRAAAAPVAVAPGPASRPSRPVAERFTPERPGLWAWLKRVTNGPGAMEGNQ
jgi:type II secretory pathway predicted ATPase ExeA